MNSNQNKKKVNRLREFLVTRVKVSNCFDVLYNAKVKSGYGCSQRSGSNRNSDK